MGKKTVTSEIKADRQGSTAQYHRYVLAKLKSQHRKIHKEPIQSLNNKQFSTFVLNKWEQVTESLKCPICLQFVAISLVTTCGHVFCSRCLHISFKNLSKCPSCRSVYSICEAAGNSLMDKIIQKILEKQPNEQLKKNNYRRMKEAKEWQIGRKLVTQQVRVNQKVDILSLDNKWVEGTVKQIKSDPNEVVKSIIVEYKSNEGSSQECQVLQLLEVTSNRLAPYKLFSEIPQFSGGFWREINFSPSVINTEVIGLPQFGRRNNFRSSTYEDMRLSLERARRIAERQQIQERQRRRVRRQFNEESSGFWEQVIGMGNYNNHELAPQERNERTSEFGMRRPRQVLPGRRIRLLSEESSSNGELRARRHGTERIRRPDYSPSIRNDETLNNETLNNETLNNEIVNYETLNNETLNNEIINYETLNNETVNNETLNDRAFDEYLRSPFQRQSFHRQHVQSSAGELPRLFFHPLTRSERRRQQRRESQTEESQRERANLAREEDISIASPNFGSPAESLSRSLILRSPQYARIIERQGAVRRTEEHSRGRSNRFQ